MTYVNKSRYYEVQTGANFPRGREMLRRVSGKGALVLSAYGGLFRRCFPSVTVSASRIDALTTPQTERPLVSEATTTK